LNIPALPPLSVQTNPSLWPHDQLLPMHGAISDTSKAMAKIAPAIKFALAQFPKPPPAHSP